MVGVILGRMENIGKKTVFSTIWQKMENTEDGKPGRKFSLSGPQISSSQIGGKLWGENLEKWTYGIFTQMPSGIKLKIKIK